MKLMIENIMIKKQRVKEMNLNTKKHIGGNEVW